MEKHKVIRPIEIVRELLISDAQTKLSQYLESLSSGDLVFVMSRLSKKEQQKLFIMLNPEEAAIIIEELPEVQAIDIIEDMDSENAAAIINEMMSNERADLFMELHQKDAEAILTEMKPEEAASLRKLIQYDPDSAGGLMITEYFRYYEWMTVRQVLEDIKINAEKYKNYTVRYLYITAKKNKFVGVLQMQDLLLANQDQQLSEIVVKDVKTINVMATLDEVSDLFDTYDFYGFPVVDADQMMVGVLRRKSVLEAINERAAYEHLETQGIVGGDELRTMPVLLRSRRRLSWLSVNILLNIIAASVIAFYQETLQAVIALAVFLPIISDMSGCSGNQAVAVSMRELSLGTVRPSEVMRVWFQEISIGLINGLVLGLLIGIAAFFWKGSIYLGLVVGGALAVNTLVAVSLGGTIPLILKKFNIDPALASGPILTTVTDMIGFFLALSFATIALSHISGL
jgi:magnesium transporter